MVVPDRRAAQPPQTCSLEHLRSVVEVQTSISEEEKRISIIVDYARELVNLFSTLYRNIGLQGQFRQ